MKYEAKDGGSHTAVSVAAGIPWVSIPRQEAGVDDDAQEACENNGAGAGYQLIGNHHWQAIARNIELVSENFDTSGAEADHAFNHGHADDDGDSPGGSSSTGALAADADDANACSGIGDETAGSTAGSPISVAVDCGGVWHINKRTNTLTNGEVIWDFSGNVNEWVRDNNSTTHTSGSDYIQTVPYSDSLKWGPANDYSAQTGTQQAGLGIFSDSSTGAVRRGGNWYQEKSAGLFTVYLSFGPTNSSSNIGFRCVFAP